MQIPISRRDSTGTNLNFTVVGGTTQPTNPKENTIWVNTDTEITGWEFSSTQPASPVAGMVWIRTGTVSPVNFNTLQENNATIYPITCNQYINGSFIGKTAVTYQNGEWKDWTFWLYKQGDLCENITGGWDGTILLDSTWNSNKLTLNSTSMIGSYTAKLTDIYRCTSNPIDLSGKIVHMRYSLSATNKDGTACLRMYSNLDQESCVAQAYTTTAAGGYVDGGIVTVDCSDLTMPVYVIVDAVSATASAAATFTVYEVWAEEA